MWKLFNLWLKYEFGDRRGVLVREADDEEMAPVDITPKEFSVRSCAQEYGGGAFAISGNKVIFSNNKDQRLYLQSIAPGGNLLIVFEH